MDAKVSEWHTVTWDALSPLPPASPSCNEWLNRVRPSLPVQPRIDSSSHPLRWSELLEAASRTPTTGAAGPPWHPSNALRRNPTGVRTMTTRGRCWRRCGCSTPTRPARCTLCHLVTRCHLAWLSSPC